MRPRKKKNNRRGVLSGRVWVKQSSVVKTTYIKFGWKIREKKHGKKKKKFFVESKKSFLFFFYH